MMFKFEWDSGNLEKLAKVKASGRDFGRNELESVFDDPNRMLYETTPDPVSGEYRYLYVGLSNLNRVISVIFVVRMGADGQEKIRIFNGWKTKGRKLKIYNEKSDR